MAGKQSDPLFFKKSADQYIKGLRYNRAPGIAYHDKLFWRYIQEEGAWAPKDREEVTQAILRWLTHWNISSDWEMATKITRVVQAHTAVERAHPLPMPFWLDKRDAGPQVVLRNGILDVDEIEACQPLKLRPHDPQWFSQVSFPFPYRPDAGCPVFLKWLDERFEGDPERTALLQEFLGYFILPRNNRQVNLALAGLASTGKGTLLKIMHELVGGDQNTHWVPLRNLADKHIFHELSSKVLMIVDEVEEMNKRVEEMMKWFVTGAPVHERGMYRVGRSQRPTARLVMSLNEFPKIHDRTDAIYRRLKILPMNAVIRYDSYVLDFEQTLRPEFPGIFNWALEGVRRFQQHGWTVCRAGEDTLDTERFKNQPWRQWVEERIRSQADGFVATADLERSYKRWARNPLRQRRVDVSPNALLDMILLKHPQARRTRKRVKRVPTRGLAGIKILPEKPKK